MFKPRSFFMPMLIVIFLSAFVFAQENSGLKPLSAGANLTETQEWLKTAISKSASFDFANLKNDVPEVIFNGCQMSFTNTVKMNPAKPMPRHSYRDNRGGASPQQTIGNSPSASFSKGPNGPVENLSIQAPRDTFAPWQAPSFGGTGGSRSASRSKYVTSMRYTFDLAQMDATLTSETPIILGGKKPVVFLGLWSDQPIVNIAGTLGGAPNLQRLATFTLPPEDVPAIKATLLRAMDLCRAGN